MQSVRLRLLQSRKYSGSSPQALTATFRNRVNSLADSAVNSFAICADDRPCVFELGVSPCEPFQVRITADIDRSALPDPRRTCSYPTNGHCSRIQPITGVDASMPRK